MRIIKNTQQYKAVVRMNFNVSFGEIIIICFIVVLLILIIKMSSEKIVSRGNSDKSASADIKMQPDASVTTERNTDELELVAAIIAAIAVSMGTTSDKLQVKSLRKVERIVR